MTGVFEMMTGPYIPAEHVPLDVLPWNREEGYEVFSYPPELNDVDDALFEAEGLNRNERGTRVALIYPYGYHSYGEYFAHLQGYVDKYEKTAPELADSIRRLIESIKRMNVKEDWSVVRYVGHEYDNNPRVFGLTRGRCYYWPCSKEKPVYEGVIDDEEFTSYLYPCDAGVIGQNVCPPNPSPFSTGSICAAPPRPARRPTSAGRATPCPRS